MAPVDLAQWGQSQRAIPRDDALRSTDSPRPAFDLTTVIGVQRALTSLKVPNPPLIEDGVSGTKTRAAVREFQRSHDLVVDGVVGEETRAALKAALDQPTEIP
jgi:peptidoglycan hydrolase-like protein with peptidoglycan-binding domain